MKRFAQINRNILNFPLARSRNTQSWDWQRDTDGWIVGKPPRADTGFEFYLPAGTSRTYWRCPTGFEISLLLECSAKAQALETDIIEFESIPAVLGLMGISDNSHYCKRAREAFDYLSRIRVCFPRWYLAPGHYQKNKIIRPIRSIRYDGARIIIELSPVFARRPEKKKGYRAKIPLPLPHHEPAQNTIFCILAWFWPGASSQDRMRLGARPQNFRPKVGLGSHKNSPARYDAMIKRVVEPWFETVYGWKLCHKIDVDTGRIFVWLSKLSRKVRKVDASDAKVEE